MRTVKSRIAELDLDANDTIITRAFARRSIAYSHSWKKENCDFLPSLWKAVEGGHSNLALAYYYAISDGTIYDSLRICSYREAIWRAIKEIKEGMPGEDIVAHLESVLDKMKDGIESLDISEEEFEKRCPSPRSKTKNKQNCSEV